ncbi:saccharopine dehydrogenase NADP-binding domain-containing protein [Candidatus Bipolaricaulota bacterium]|nr:saccharopine dehydrogenase NADP-binding domain-containing protein [Candidatus Bipolaricaulota bacterium]
MKIVVLGGAGKMAPGANRFLVNQEDVSKVVIADKDIDRAKKEAANLGGKAEPEYADFKDPDSLVDLLSDAEVVLNSTVYYSNLKVMDACLDTKTHYVDLGGLFHTAKKQLKLSPEFERAGITAINGMGSAPGIVNIMARYGVDRLDTAEYIRIRDGIVSYTDTEAPVKAPYALDTLLDEFTKPAQVFEGGEFKELPPFPFSEPEEVQFPEPVGTQPSYPTLHTEVYTLPKTFGDKGIQEVNFKLALPSVFKEKLKLLVQLGFGEEEPIRVGGVEVSPRQVLNELLSRFEDEKDKSPDDHKVLRVEVGGEKDGREVEYRLESIMHPMEKYNLATGTLTVGGPGGMAAWMLARGDIKKRGVFPPEQCIDPEYFFKLMGKWHMPVYSIVRTLVN